MNTDANNLIVEFEKDQKLKSTKASMGIYIFDWQRLGAQVGGSWKEQCRYVRFQKCVPNYLESGESVYAYDLKAIGKTLVRLSLWEANMEYINPENALDSHNRRAGRFILATYLRQTSSVKMPK